MRRSLLIILFLLARMAAAGVQYSEQVRQWPQVRLQLSQEVTLGDVFASGLHPYRRPFGEHNQVFVKHAIIEVINRDGTNFPPFPAEIVRMRVQKPDLIERIEMWSPPITVSEARTEARRWLSFIGKTEKDLDGFLAAVAADWLQYDIAQGSSDVVRFAGGLRDPDGMRISVLLMKSWQWQAPLRLCFELSTGSMASRKRTVYYAVPIPPPPGFENADMTAPKDWEVDTRFIPLTTEPRPAQGTLPPEYQAMNDKAQAEAESKKKAPVRRTQLNRLNPFSTGGPGDEPALRWGGLLIAIAAVSGLVWAVMKRRKG